MVLQRHITNKNHYISTTRVSVATKFDRIITCLDGLIPIKAMTLWSHGLARSRDRLKALHFLYYSACDHQTWHGGDLPWGASIIIVTWLFNHVVWLDHVTSWKYYISITTTTMTTILDKVVNLHEGLPPINSLNPLNTCSREVTWQIKNISPL